MKHIYLLLAAFSFCFTQQASASEMIEIPEGPSMEATAPMSMDLWDDQESQEIEVKEITLTFEESQVHVTNATGKNLEIYNLTGVRLATFRIDSDDKTLNLNLPKGCYILKVGNVVRKVSIR